jgi:hypothetical protein
MGRAIQIPAVLLTGLLLAAAPLLAQTPPQAPANPPGVEVKGTIRLPPGTRIDTSKTLKVEVVLGPASRVPGSFVSDAGANQTKPPSEKEIPPDKQPSRLPTAPTNNGSPAPPPSNGVLKLVLIILLAVAATAAAAGIGAWYYFKRFLPRREMEPYQRALEAIRHKNYRAALPDLTAVESKLTPDLRHNARFFIALCHYHLDDESEAEHLAADLLREKPSDENVAYLLAYIRISRGLDELAEPVLEGLRKSGHLGFRETRKLLGIVKFRRGLAALRGGNVEAAAEFFAEVQKLGDYAAFVPADLRNRHVGLGTRALFDQDVATARQHFEALAQVAAAMEEDKGKDLLAKAKLGLALADWLEDSPARADAIEQALVEACRLFHPEGAEELPWPEPVPGSAKGAADALKRALEEANLNFNLPADQKAVRRCLRDVHLLRAMLVLRVWARMDGERANHAIGERLKATLSRLACARAIDERFADVYLMAGLLMYYLHEPGPERTTGIDLLEESRKLGVRDPDALEIVNNRERIEKANADAVDKYQQALDHYLRDETVRKEVRHALLQRLSTHRSLMNRYRPPDLTRSRTVPATVEEMFLRSKTLRERIEEMGPKSGNPRLTEQSNLLRRQGEELQRQADELQDTESALLALTGEELFKDV